MKQETKVKKPPIFKSAVFFKTQKSEFNILLFVLLYVLLLQGFYLYVGITSEGGKLFWPFLRNYLNFPQWFTIVIAKTSKFLLQLSGYTVYQRSASNITIAGGRGVTIAWACLGAGAMSLWVAFITAHKAAIKYKIKWILPGIILICLVNVFRIITIALSYHYNWQYPLHFDAHTSFNVLTYMVILIFMYLFARNYSRTKSKTALPLSA